MKKKFEQNKFIIMAVATIIFFIIIGAVGNAYNRQEEKKITVGNFTKSTQTSTPTSHLDIPNEQQLIKCYTDALSELTNSTIVSSTYKNYEPGTSETSIDMAISMSDDKNLDVSALYMSTTKEWCIILIKNAQNSHLYYVPEELKSKYEIYDYTSEKILLNEESTEDTTFNYKARLTHGYYYAGINIPCGSYDAKWISGSGSISFEDEPGFGIRLGKGKDNVKKYKNIDLTDFVSYIEIQDDLVIEISCNDAFIPTEKYENKDAKQITLESGTYEAGIDFTPGIYDIKCLKGSGNIQTDGEINDIMATKSGWNYFSYQSKKLNHIMIREGEKLKLKSIKVKMTPSKLEYEKNLAK